MRRLDIGIVAYRDAAKLRQAVARLKQFSTTDWRLLIVDNPCDGSPIRKEVLDLATDDPRIEALLMETNVGYAGGVNEILKWSTTEYTAYLDHDAYVLTAGWDEKLASYLDRYHEIGMIFPGGGAYPIERGSYTEILWGVGFCWMLNRLAQAETGLMDETLGHQDEVDYQIRVRMEAWKCAAAVEVLAQHDATATNDPASIERINRGVRNFVNKWTRYFGGKNLNYHSPNVLRFEDWPINSLYLEEYWKLKLPGLNDNPETITIDGRRYDLLKVPRIEAFYRGRIH